MADKTHKSGEVDHTPGHEATDYEPLFGIAPGNAPATWTGGERRPAAALRRRRRSATASAGPPPAAPPIQASNSLSGAVQRKSETGGPAAPSSSKDTAKSLPEAVQGKMETAFGADFSSVKVHEGPQASAMGAHAFAQGESIHFAPGRFQPESPSGQALIGHELTHVVQQRAGRVTTPQGKGGQINADPSLEAEADRLGQLAARGEKVSVAGATSMPPAADERHGAPAQRKVTSMAAAKAPIQLAGDEDKKERGSSTTSESKDAPKARTVEDLASLSPDEKVEAVLAARTDKLAQKLIKAFSSDEAFMAALTKDKGGKGFSLVGDLITGGWGKVPNLISAYNLAGQVPSLGSGKSSGVTMLAMAPLALLGAIINVPVAAYSAISRTYNPRRFPVNAIEAAYDCKFTKPDKWSNSALRKMWTAFAMVPQGHVRETVKKLEPPDSMFNPGSSYGAGQTITMARLPTSISMGTAEHLIRATTGKFLMKKSKYSKRMKSKNAFTMTALHEVGHGVDDRLKVMDKKGAEASWGSWWRGDKHSAIKQMWNTCTAEKGLQSSDGRKLGAPVLKDFVDSAARGASVDDKFPTWSTNVNRQLGSNALTTAQLKEFKAQIKSHPVIKMISFAGKNQQWERSRSSLNDLAQHFGGRTWHDAYGDDSWASYLVTAKDQGVSHYQFRAPGEYFAELYAHYYMGTLDGHPHQGWIAENIDKKVDAKTGAVKSKDEEEQEKHEVDDKYDDKEQDKHDTTERASTLDVPDISASPRMKSDDDSPSTILAAQIRARLEDDS